MILEYFLSASLNPGVPKQVSKRTHRIYSGNEKGETKGSVRTKTNATDKPEGNALGGLGIVAAENLVKAREEARFSTWDDIKQRGKASKTVIDLLEANGCLVGIPRSNQISLFG